jgi:hypothetical protein
MGAQVSARPILNDDIGAFQRIRHITDGPKAVLKLVFGRPLRYKREKSFLEPELALPFRALAQFLPETGNWRRGSPPRRFPTVANQSQ